MGKDLSLAGELPLDKRSDKEILTKMQIEIEGQRKILRLLEEVAEQLASNKEAAVRDNTKQ